MLDGFLQHALHLGVGVAHLTGEVTHTAHIDLAEHHKEGQQSDGDDRQQPVESKEIGKSTEEEKHHTERIGQGFGNEGDDIADVALKAVDDIARVSPFAPVPFGAEYTVEHVLLHAVLRLHAQHVAYPDRGYVDGKVDKHQPTHECHRPVDGALDAARSHVDGAFHRPHLGQTYHHRSHAHRCVEYGLQSVAPPYLPQPAHDVARGVGRVGGRYPLGYLYLHDSRCGCGSICGRHPTSSSRGGWRSSCGCRASLY